MRAIGELVVWLFTRGDAQDYLEDDGTFQNPSLLFFLSLLTPFFFSFIVHLFNIDYYRRVSCAKFSEDIRTE